MTDSLPETDKAETPKKRHLWVILLLGVIVVAALVYGVSRVLPNLGGASDYTQFKTGSLAALEVRPDPPPQPVAPFFDESGQPTTLASSRGKVVLVNLWATWCAPCVAEMPTLAALQAKYSDSDFTVLAISVDSDENRDKAVAKLNELSKGTLSFYHDPKMAVVFPMKARGFPTSVLYDRNGKEIARLAGEADWNSAQAYGLVEAALGQK